MTSAERRQRQLAPVRTGLYVRAESGLKLRHRKVRRLVTKMRHSMPWLADADLPAARTWAELELLGARAFADLEASGITTAKGEPRRLLAEFRQLRQAQLAYERDLGMTPASRMSLRVGDSKARATDVVTALAAQAKAVGASTKTPRRQLPDGGRSFFPDGSSTGVALQNGHDEDAGSGLQGEDAAE